MVRRAQLLLQRAATAAELRAAQSVLFVNDYGLSLLNTFTNRGRYGQAIAVKSIWQAYEAMLGRSVPDSTIYRLLQRYGWHNATRGAYHSNISPASRRLLPLAPGRSRPSSRRTRTIESS